MSASATTYKRPDRSAMQLLHRFVEAPLARGGKVVVGPTEVAILCAPGGRVAILQGGEHLLAPATSDLGALVASAPVGQPIPGPLYFVRTREMTGQTLQGNLAAGAIRFRLRALLSFVAAEPLKLVRELGLPRPDADGPTLLTAMSRAILSALAAHLDEGATPVAATVQFLIESSLVDRGLRVTGVGPIEIAPEGSAATGGSSLVRVQRALGLTPGDEIDAERTDGETTSGPVHRVVVGGRVRTITQVPSTPPATSEERNSGRTSSPGVNRPIGLPKRHIECPGCGLVADTARFCPSCGTSLQGAKSVQVRLCPSCAHPSERAAQFCSVCGAPFA